jgi:hypothetical protein
MAGDIGDKSVQRHTELYDLGDERNHATSLRRTISPRIKVGASVKRRISHSGYWRRQEYVLFYTRLRRYMMSWTGSVIRRMFAKLAGVSSAFRAWEYTYPGYPARDSPGGEQIEATTRPPATTSAARVALSGLGATSTRVCSGSMRRSNAACARYPSASATGTSASLGSDNREGSGTLST